MTDNFHKSSCTLHIWVYDDTILREDARIMYWNVVILSVNLTQYKNIHTDESM
jgi:hypothetical protein